jgi:hypothetical protein
MTGMVSHISNVVGKTARLLRRSGLHTSWLLLASSFCLTCKHLWDLFSMDPASGVWLGLALYTNEGVFYPPLESDGHYAGTRYMPIVFCLQALIARLTGQYLLSAKISSALSFFLLLVAVFAAVRTVTRSSLIALAVAALLPAFRSMFLMGLLNVRGDLLPAALSVSGVLLLSRRGPQRWSLPLAAVLFSAAFLAKFTAIAGCIASIICLVGWKRKVALLSMVLGISFTCLIVIQFLSAGRFLVNLRHTGGTETHELVVAMFRPFYLTTMLDPASLPLFLGCCSLRFTENLRHFKIWDWYFVLSVLEAYVVLTAPGTSFNHLVDLQAAGLIVLSQNLTEREGTSTPSGSWSSNRLTFAGVGLIALCGIYTHASTWWQSIVDVDQYQTGSLIRAIPASHKILTDDPSIPVLLGNRPVILDPFSFRLLSERGDIDAGALAQRVLNHEFSAIILSDRIDAPGQSLYPRVFLGTRLTEAIRSSYHFAETVGKHHFFIANTRGG